MYKIVDVAINKTNYDFDLLFSYFVPDSFSDNVKEGMRVIVPFGKSNSERQGLIMAVKSSFAIDNLKPIITVIDDDPIINSEGIRLIKFLKETTFCTYYNAVKLLLPVGLYVDNSKLCSLNQKALELYSPNPSESVIIEYLLSKCENKRSKSVKLETLFEDLSITKKDESFCSLVSNNIIELSEEISQRMGDKTMKMVKLSEKYCDEDLSSIKMTENQRRVVDLLKDFSIASVKEILYYANVNKSTIDTLVKKGYAEYSEKEVYRTPKCISEASFSSDFSLSDEQQSVYESISKDMIDEQKSKTGLLYGVTGSGKTQIFIKLIHDCIDKGKNAILLVPEISLTTQATKVFCGEFGKSVALIHSGLSPGERMDEFKRIKNGEAKVIIGTRSAVFAPCENIGIIIIDEEQDSSYKSESSPRFHSRDVASFRCKNNNAYLLLASATPSVESYYKAKMGVYNLYNLPHRFSGNDLPQVIIKDTSDNLNPNRVFSDTLLRELEKNLNNNAQSIILLNRRGYNTVIKCSNCSNIISCVNCSVPLTYHSANGSLICHQCGYKTFPPKVCDKCGSSYISYNGAGTQMAEENLKSIFPNARILRMDLDTTMSKYACEKKFAAFLNHEYDIMIGTQMVAKGHNFPDVTLVGVLGADNYLYSDDFRAFEKTFSLITQVVGRSGRFEKKGRAIIETSMPESDVIIDASNQDYIKFFEKEIKIRKETLYPPFCSLCVIGFSSPNDLKTENAAKCFKDILINLKETNKYKNLPIRIFGPCKPQIQKLNNKYRYKITIKCKNNIETRELISKAVIKLSRLKDFKEVSSFVDMYYDGNF